MYDIDNIGKDGIARCRLCLNRASVKTWLEEENEPWEEFCAGCALRLMIFAALRKPMYYGKQIPGAVVDYIKERLLGIYI